MKDKHERNAGYRIREHMEIGDLVIVLGEHETEPNMFVTWQCKRNTSGPPSYYWGHYFTSYLDAVVDYTDRIKEEAQSILEFRQRNHLENTMLNAFSCIPDADKHDYAGQVVVLRGNALPPECRTVDYQICRVTANNANESVRCKNLYTGKEENRHRDDILGVIKPECLPDWAKRRLAYIEKTRNEPER